MHRAKALYAAALLTLMILLNASAVLVRAEDEDTDAADEYDVTARVVRARLIEGQVDLRRAGNKDWERAGLNLPLVEGDTLATASDARLEIQIDARNFVRVGANSLLRIVTLRNEGIVLSLVEGTATVRLARFDRSREYFEIDMPKTTMTVEQPGLYRLDVAHDGGLRLTVRDGGHARIYANDDGFTLRDGRTAELTYAGREEGDWQFSAASSFDSWDTWVDDRERYLAERLRYDERDRYYDADIWGAEELDAYGNWVNAGDYGWVWRPHTTVINHYENWAPYRQGQWRWCPPYGWTWVGDEPWGWAPYHYGRWVYYNQGWCWAPRGYGFRDQHSWWRPALVAFVYVASSHGQHVAWYPLTYRQHDPFRRNHRPGRGQWTPHRAGEPGHPRLFNPAMARAVTTVPAREFGRYGARLQPAATDIARGAINTEPVRTRLPFAPRESDQDTAGAAARDRRSRTWPSGRPAPSTPAGTLEERPTGAAARAPGVSLDDELWRSRLRNGRPSRPRGAPAEGTAIDPAARGTGAVARPARPAARPPLDAGDTDVDRNYRNNLPSGARPTIPARPPSRPRAPRNEDRPPVSPDESIAPAPPVRERPPARRPPRTAEPPAQPHEVTPTPPTERREIPGPPHARPERPAPVERDAPVERPAPPERREAPSPPQEQISPPEPSRPEPSRVEPSRPEPPRPETPAPPREEPAPPPPAEPARREETPSPPPPTPEPPPRDEPPAPAPPAPAPAPAPEPQREAPSPPPDRLPEEDRARPPLD